MTTIRLVDLVAIADAARRYVSASHAAADASGPELVPASVELEAAFHDLAVAVDGDCRFCDPDTCPGLVDTRPL